MRAFAKSAFAALVLTVVRPAFAGERTNLSTLPTLASPKEAESPGKKLGVPGLSLREASTQGTSYYEIKAATGQGYCLVNRDHVFELETDTTVAEHNELWRLVEKDDSATLERTIYQVAPYLDNAWVKSKASVELKALATDFGITAWGMRDTNGDVVILARRATFGRESQSSARSESEPVFGNSSSTCTFGAVRVLAASLKGGGSAQLTGRLPAVGEGKSRTEPQFMIDVSALKLSRDPEPVLSVRFRKRSEG